MVWRGGASGKPGSNALTVDGRTKKLAAKTRFMTPSGSVLSIATPGGGGFGAKSGVQAR